MQQAPIKLLMRVLFVLPPGNDDGTWSLTGTTVMVIDGDPVNLESFDCNKLIIVNTDTQVSGDRLKLTLTRQ